MDWLWIVALALVVLGMCGWFAILFLRLRGYGPWMVTYWQTRDRRQAPRSNEPVHVLLCAADHYEPKQGNASVAAGQARVERWVSEYPRQFARFRDSDGRTPRHTFFFPVEEYEPAYLDSLAGLCRGGFGEVEIHLHHHDDTPDNLRRTLSGFRDLLAERHGLLARHKDTGKLMYGFVHGNWALCNSRPDGRWCGVNEEIDILLETGCYADFTFPSAPDRTQPRLINFMYYAVNQPGRPCSHFNGWPLGAPNIPDKSLLLIPGPLLLNWRQRKWGLLPRIENSCLQASQPPSLDRLDRWLAARIQVPRRPDWFFVKLHAHGAPEDAQPVLLGDPMVRFHESLAQRAAANPNFHFHYVTAREMYNLAKAAEAGFAGSVAEARDFVIRSQIT